MTSFDYNEDLMLEGIRQYKAEERRAISADPGLQRRPPARATAINDEPEMTLAEAIQGFKRSFITTALRRHRGSVTRTADALALHRNSLERIIHELKIDVSDIKRRAA